MRYITATIGGLLIFVGAFILSAFLCPLLPPIFQTPVQLGLFYTNNIAGLVLALLAGIASFRATLRRARAKDAAKHAANEAV